MRELVLIHGRSQERKDSIALKKEWLDTLQKGLAKSGLPLPIAEERVRFPFYGDALYDLVSGTPTDQAAKVVVRGEAGEEDPELHALVARILEEVADRHGITDAQKLEAARTIARGQPVVIDRGPLNWGWVQALLCAVDQHVPGASAASIALATRDVYLYLRNGRIRRKLNEDVRKAMTPGVESVVVGHSLGTIVSYWLLGEEGTRQGWKVPLYVTLGSPLAVTAIKEALRQELQKIEHPPCVRQWFNAMDSADAVALYPLDPRHFPVEPPIQNKTDVHNPTENRHGILGYLNDKEVAKRIHDALVAA